MKNQSELINKYNIPVPRYTSYPPANHFYDDFSDEDYKNAIVESNSHKPENISIYIHIPFCKRMCYYCGCNSCPAAKDAQVHSYIQALKKEMNLIFPLLRKSRKLSQIHYGGGTPNAISLDYISELNSIILNEFDTIARPEIAIECNPGYLAQSDIDKLNEAGFNRISLGIQDFNKKVLDNVNREESKLSINELMAYIKQVNPEFVINLDFIYGLPGQTAESFLETMKQAAELKPERLVTFSYAHVPWVNKRQLILEKRGLPAQSEKLEMYLNSYEFLKSQNYKPLGLDHYVIEGDELYKAYTNKELHRNFQGYCTRRTTGQVYAFGASAISQLENVYAQNAKENNDYIESLENGILPVQKGYKLSRDEKIIRDVITDFMCNKFLDLNKAAERNGINTEKLKEIINLDKSVLKDFEEDGILIYDNENIRVKEEGVLFIRNVAASLDPNFTKQTKKYSTSV